MKPERRQWIGRITEFRRAIETAESSDIEAWSSLFEAMNEYGLEPWRIRRAEAVREAVAEVSAVARGMGRWIGLDLFTPSLTGLVGQDYRMLQDYADWIKPMSYCHAKGPAGMPLELASLARGIMIWNPGLSETAVMGLLGRTFALPELPADAAALEAKGLPEERAGKEYALARTLADRPLYPGFECVRHPDFDLEITADNVRRYCGALTDAPGTVISWNILYIPEDYLPIVPVGAMGICRVEAEKKRFAELCRRIGYYLPGSAKVRSIGSARKLAEIAKALAHDATLIIMDEPTDSLSGGEMEAFFTVVEDLRRKGITIIYITHHLGELFRISDRVTVLKDGRRVKTMEIKETSGEDIVTLMLGASEPDSAAEAAPSAAESGPELLRTDGLGRGGMANGVSLSLRRGEITGLVGVIGSGKTELARLLFGADRRDRGDILVKGVPVAGLSPRSAKRAGSRKTGKRRDCCRTSRSDGI